MKKIIFILVIPFLFAFDDDDNWVDVARKYVSMDGRATLVLKHSGKAVETIAAIHWIKLRGKWSSDGEMVTITFEKKDDFPEIDIYEIVPDTLKLNGEAVFVRKR